MTKQKREGATASVRRISTIRRRFRNLYTRSYKTETQKAEISALEWALPILEKFAHDTYGELPPERHRHYKHERLEIIERLLPLQNNVCYLCYKPMTTEECTIDHVVPLSRGGHDNESNYKICHEACNIEKGNMMLEDYRKMVANKLIVDIKPEVPEGMLYIIDPDNFEHTTIDLGVIDGVPTTK